MIRVLCLIIGYVCGLFQTGYFYGRINGIDIRTQGSGNAGTTNALRTLGWKAGVITFLGDFLKCLAAVGIVRILFKDSYPEMFSLLAVYAGAGTILGHNYPFYLKGKGGKGIAATAGLILAINPWMALSAYGLFILVVAITRYVSLGSLLMMLLFTVEVIVFGQRGYYQMGQGHLYEMYVIVVLLMGLAYYKHWANIIRLKNGNENKLKFRK